LALDYTDSGKIKGFLADNNSLNKRVTIQDLADENFDSWDSIIRELFNENSPS
jgi:hypothetical protein